MKNFIKSIAIVGVLCSSLASMNVMADEAVTAAPAGPTLYERIGGEKGTRAIVEDVWTNHTNNPIIKARFLYSDPVRVKQVVFEIFAVATGGDVEYTGMDLAERHSNMNISEMEFNAVVDDIMDALTKNNVAQKEQDEILAVLWATRPAIVNGNMTTQALTAK
ncbi:MAG: group 1 truncated hemoglobin [Piscirickettsiaceae bacterium]|nr:group 1 truncated hemoglobin [Piscirickettsiaceae bacterium]